MSTTSISTPPTNIALSPRIRLLSIGLSLVAVMSVTRLWTGFDNLTSSGTIGAALRLTVPIMLAGLAGLWAERVGILNICLLYTSPSPRDLSTSRMPSSA